LKSCQLVRELTGWKEGLNTCRSTHRRRSEIYMYFNVRDDALVVHFQEALRLRHIIVRNGQA
jgi:4-deoxy-L-threo-5-hexosulose-uronate ketol-isomerase